MCHVSKRLCPVATVLIENQQSRLIQRHLPKSREETGRHKDDYIYAVLPFQNGRSKIDDTNNAMGCLEFRAAVPYSRDHGVENGVLSDHDVRLAFIQGKFRESS